MLILEDVGLEIKNARILKDLSASDLAKKVHVSENTILNYEKGKIASLDVLEDICKEVDKDYDELITDDQKLIFNMISKGLEGQEDKQAVFDKFIAWINDAQRKGIKITLQAIATIVLLSLMSTAVYAMVKKSIWRFDRVANDSAYFEIYLEGDEPSERIKLQGYRDVMIREPIRIDDESLSVLDEAFRGNVYLPTYMPSGYTFNEVNILPEEDEFSKATITYSSGDADLIFELTEIEEATDGYELIGDISKRTEQSIVFDNVEFNLMMYESENNKTAYLVSNYVIYKIQYDVSTEQLIRIVESFAYLNPIESIIDGNNVDNNSDDLQIVITEEEPIQIGTKVHETATNIDGLASTFSKDVFVIDHLPEGLELKESRYRTDIINFASITYATDTYDKKINLEMVEIAKDSGVYANIGIGENAFTSEQEVKIGELSVILNHSWSDGDGFNFIVFVHDEIMYKFSYTIDTDEMIKVIENMTYISRE